MKTEEEMSKALDELGLENMSELKSLQDQIANQLPESDRNKIIAAVKKRNRKNAKRLELEQR